MSGKKKIVGILRGGKGDFYNASLDNGSDFFSHITRDLPDKWKPADILIDKNEVWHLNGIPIKPSDLVHKVNVVWNFSHPIYSDILRKLSIPVVGEDSFSFSLKNSRDLLKKHMKMIGLEMPKHLVLPVYQKDFDGMMGDYATSKAKEIIKKFPAPYIVKSLREDKDMGVHVAKTFLELVDAIVDGVNHNESILVEELISGKNVFMHSVSDFRGEDVYVFPTGNFSKSDKEKLYNFSKNIHNHIGVSKYLKSNFVLNPKMGIYLTSIEFHPDLRQDSHFAKTCISVGAKESHIIEHILESVL